VLEGHLLGVEEGDLRIVLLPDHHVVEDIQDLHVVRALLDVHALLVDLIAHVVHVLLANLADLADLVDLDLHPDLQSAREVEVILQQVVLLLQKDKEIIDDEIDKISSRWVVRTM